MANETSSRPSDPAPASPIPPPAPEEPNRFLFVTLAFVVLIVAVLVYIDQLTPVDLRLLNYRWTPEELGRQVTFVNISPLAGLTVASGESVSTVLNATVYTKIGHKAVQAAGLLSLVLKDARGNVVQSWKDIRLPADGPEVGWAGFPLGGWHMSLALKRSPATPETWLEATYTNPAQTRFMAPRTPVQITAR